MNRNLVYAQLNSLLRNIRQEATAFLPNVAVPTADSHKYEAAQQKFARWEAELARLADQLVSADRQLGSRGESGLWGLPRDQRYPARQSLDDRRAAIADAMSAVRQTQQELAAVIARFGGLTPAEMVQAVSKLASQITGSAEAMQKARTELSKAVSHPSGPAFVMRDSQAVGGQDLLVSLAVVGRLVQILALKVASRFKQR
jgi:hypothetical protein